jgi:pimeloyl-ACP methyl ester carboxylesterase
MGEPLPTVLVPGLNCSARLYADQIPALWRFGPLLIADHTRDDSMGAIAARILNAAPPRFALIGLSMGGYIALEIMSQAPARVAKLALLDTGARADTPEPTGAIARSSSRKPAALPRYPSCCFRCLSTATVTAMRS